MIIEGLLTTTDSSGRAHVAPMGPVVDEEKQSWLLRPFQSSRTFELLRANPNCHFHIVDDVLLVVECLLADKVPSTVQRGTDGWILADACQWYHLRIDSWNLEKDRSEAQASVISQQQIRPFWGWNRAKHAILEAAILSTRLHLLDVQAVRIKFANLEEAVLKTAGKREMQAWKVLNDYLAEHS